MSNQQRIMIFGKPSPKWVVAVLLTIIFSALLYQWQHTSIRPSLVSRPSDIWAYIIGNWSPLLYETSMTGRNVAIGIMFGALVGYPLGLAVTMWRTVVLVLAVLVFMFFTFPAIGDLILFAKIFTPIFGVQSIATLHAFNMTMAFAMFFLGGFLCGRGIDSGAKNSLSSGAIDALNMNSRSKLRIFRFVVLPYSWTQMLASAIVTSVFLWKFQILTEAEVLGAPFLGDRMWTFGKDSWDAEPFISAMFMMAIGNGITWSLFLLIQKFISSKRQF